MYLHRVVVPEQTPQIEAYIDTVYITPKTGRKLHIPFNGKALCGEAAATEKKSLAMYPPPHRSWCSNCRELWQQSTTRIIEYHTDSHEKSC